MPHRDPQSIQGYSGMIQLDFLSHRQHCCHMETDCRGQHTQLKLVVLEIKFSIVLFFFLKKIGSYVLFFCSTLGRHFLHIQDHKHSWDCDSSRSMRRGCHKLQGTGLCTFERCMPSLRGIPGLLCIQACTEHRDHPEDQAGIDKKLLWPFHCKLH